MKLSGHFFISLGIILIFSGILLLILGSFFLQSQDKGEVKGGALIFIGPIPIYAGDKESLFLLSGIMIILMLGAYFFLHSGL